MKSPKKRIKEINNKGCDLNKDIDMEDFIIKKTKKSRSCLMCGGMFNSFGVHNRRCPRCSRRVNLRNIDSSDSSTIYKVSFSGDDNAPDMDLFKSVES